MVMNTISPISADSILHAEDKGRGRFPGSSRGDMVICNGSVGEEKLRFTDWYMTRNDILPKHIPDQCGSAPIPMLIEVAMNKGMQDQVWKDSKVC
jgi:hypothetical protein